ncbi:MAG: bifunctional DNA-formamidopyrimidine glycosylase/DNA-(apurinic or apyrimidinic site) lyase [Alphaproteobacteria bacterium]
MPELPEVETIRRGLERALAGRVLSTVEARVPALRFPLPAQFAERLEGRRVAGIGRRGKFILVHLDDEQVLLIHLGMSGRLRLFAAPQRHYDRHDHVVLRTDDGTTVHYNDARRFGLMELTTATALPRHARLCALGPEPLGNAFDHLVLSAALEGRRTPIKAALLDQRTVAGLGNIYACEALFRAGISPRRSAHTVAGRRAERLAPAIRAVLLDAIDAGGSSLRDYVDTDGELGYFQTRFAVYDREGHPCPACLAGGSDDCRVRRIVQSGRSTFYCSRHQR